MTGPIRTALVAACVAAAGAIGGCTGDGQSPSTASNRQMTPTQLAAFAASAEYPTTQTARNDLNIAAIVDRRDKSLKLYNFTTETVRDARLWVNRSFVARVDGIAPMSRVVIRGDRFYDKVGNPFHAQDVEVSRVELQTNDALYNLLGPVTEPD